MRNGSGFLQCLDRFIELFGADECKAEKPKSELVLRFYGQHSAQFSNGLVVAPSMKEDPADLDAVKCQWVKLLRPSRPRKRFLSPTLAEKPVRNASVSAGIARAQFDGSLILRLGLCPSPISGQSLRKQNVGLDTLRIQLQCLPGRSEHLRASLIRRFAKENGPQGQLGSCQTRVGRGKRSVRIKRCLKVSKGFLKPRPCFLVELKAASQVTLVNNRCHCARGDRPAALRTHRDLNVAGNPVGHIALQRQHVLQFAVIRTRPQVLVRVGPNQLYIDTNLVSRSLYRAFDDRIDV